MNLEHIINNIFSDEEIAWQMIPNKLAGGCGSLLANGDRPTHAKDAFSRKHLLSHHDRSCSQFYATRLNKLTFKKNQASAEIRPLYTYFYNLVNSFFVNECPTLRGY